MKKVVILDRDGVINQDSNEYIKSPQEWIPINGSIEAIAKLSHAGYQVIVATNQSGIARHLFNMGSLVQIHNKMYRLVEEAGGHIDGIFFCPHGPDDGCDCRKPKTGLLTDIADRLNISLEGVPMIGDSIRDLQAATAVGGLPYLVMTGKGRKAKVQLSAEGLAKTPCFDDLAAVVDHLLASD
jgi:D-glycero-D-manno-heptose 1,7-bisphosphate phosphatase